MVLFRSQQETKIGKIIGRGLRKTLCDLFTMFLRNSNKCVMCDMVSIANLNNSEKMFLVNENEYNTERKHYLLALAFVSLSKPSNLRFMISQSSMS